MLRCGVDIVHVPRIVRLLENPDALARMLCDAELARMEPQHIAGVIAAKEAFFKAFGIAPPAWHDIEIRNKENGKPTITVSARFEAHIDECDLSISHDADYAIAYVVVMTRGNNEDAR